MGRSARRRLAVLTVPRLELTHDLVGDIGRLASGRAIARQIAQDLRRYRARPAPETGRRSLLASVLQLHGGPLRETVIREILAGKNRQQAATNSAIIDR